MRSRSPCASTNARASSGSSRASRPIPGGTVPPPGPASRQPTSPTSRAVATASTESGSEARTGPRRRPARSAPPPAGRRGQRKIGAEANRAQREEQPRPATGSTMPALAADAGPTADHRQPARCRGQRRPAAHPMSSPAGETRRPGAAPAIEGAGEDSGRGRSRPAWPAVAAAAAHRGEGEPAPPGPAAFGAAPPRRRASNSMGATNTPACRLAQTTTAAIASPPARAARGGSPARASTADKIATSPRSENRCGRSTNRS